MTHKRKKVYLHATAHTTGIQFSALDGSMFGYWAGGSIEKPKWILQALVDLNGVEQAKEIYRKYNEALLHVENMGDFESPTACITLYTKAIDENNSPEGGSPAVRSDSEVYGS